MAGIVDFIKDTQKKFQFLKWVQIIPQESLATKKSALYFVEKNETEVDAIVIDDLGQKRKLTGGGIKTDLKASNVVNDSLVVGSSVKDALETITQLLSNEKYERNTALEGKVDKTTSGISAPDSNFKYAYIFDEANNTRRMLAGDLGKNIANSSLTSVTGAGMTLGAPYTWSTAGQPFYITNLPDKSTDNTFTKLKVQNASGQEAVVTNAYGILKATFGQMTASQSLELGQLLNGGVGSEGAMSVNLISPPVLEKINSNEYIMLRGANLNLNATSKKIEILNATTQAVVATIPDNQIQMYSDGLSLVFYYNFKDFTVGDFLIRLTSGSKVYLTTLTLKIVNNIAQKDLSLLNWSVLYNEASSNSGNNVFGNTSISIQTVGVGGSGLNANTAVAIKSGEIFAQGEDFYLEVGINLSNNYNDMPYNNDKSFIGIGYSSSDLNLVNLSLISLNFSYYHNSGQGVTYLYNNNLLAKTNTLVSTNEIVTIIKTGNLFRMIIGGVNYSTILSNNSGYSIFLSLVNRASTQTTQVQIIKAYTFN